MRLVLTNSSDNAEWLPQLCTWHGREPYAILSHRWHEDPEDEILFVDIEFIDQSVRGPVRNSQHAGVDPRTKPAFSKLQGAAQRALRDGYRYLWIDTCCIDKSSSAELAEAINSMFKWYSTSAICYVYLADCEVEDVRTEIGKVQFKRSQWWTRGWTLQELLAPPNLTFVSLNWAEIGRKNESSLSKIISEVSGIDVNVINSTIPLNFICIAQRMSWAANRFTSRVEDMAYSLIGIFSVNMPLLYGEGERAFLRLQQEIMKETDDETIFAWVDQEYISGPVSTRQRLKGLLATHPADFKVSQRISHLHATEAGIPFAMTNNGLSISLPLKCVFEDQYVAWLHCVDSMNSKRIGVRLKKLSSSSAQYARIGGLEWPLGGYCRKPIPYHFM